MTFRLRTALGLALATSGVTSTARAQQPQSTVRLPERPPSTAVSSSVGLPARVASFEAVADVRAFAVARAGDRVLVAYVGGEGRGRGVVRTVLLRALPAGAGLERVGQDRSLAPYGTAVAVAWDGNEGAVVYIVPRPHRGEGPRVRHRHTVQETEAHLANPLGGTSLTAADVMFQRIDAQGAPVGRAVTVFEENSRTFRAAVARTSSGWIVAWTGGITADAEVHGTVRTMHLDPQGATRPAASDTGFTGQVGDSLAIVARAGARRSSLVVWSGERCRAREDLAPHPPLEGDPSAAIEGNRQRTVRAQEGPHEHPGPPIACGPLGMFSAELREDGSTGPVIEGPALAADALTVVRTASGEPVVLGSVGEHVPQSTLAAIPLDTQGRPGRVRVVVAGAAPSSGRGPGATSPAPRTPEASTGATPSTPSSVPPPPLPDATGIARAPAMLEAATDGTNVAFAALSPTRARVVLGTQALAGGGNTDLVLLAPAARIWAVGIATAQGSAPWLFAQTGGAWNGPLLFIDGSTAAARVAQPEVPWAGDETFRTLLLRARAMRAEYTRAEGTYGPLSEREDAATNPNLPAMASMMRTRRTRWDQACSPLLERARFLSRRGVPADINEVAREVCEIPAEPSPPGTAPAPATSAAP